MKVPRGPHWHGYPAPPPKFWARIIPSDPGLCWGWAGAHDTAGYASFNNPQVAGFPSVHRILWIATHGPIPSGLEVDHTCFNRGCTNLGHLRLLTVRENRQQRYANVRPHCRNGHPWIPETTYITPKGARVCRICTKEAQERFWARRKAA